MTIACKLSEIVDAISQISVSGVTIKDRDQVAGSWNGASYCMFPRGDFVTDVSLSYVANVRGTSAKLDLSYTLHYRLIGVPSPDAAAFPKAFSDLIDKFILVVNALIGKDAPYSGKVDMELGSVENFGGVEDPAGNTFLGVDFGLLITEQQN